MKQSVTVKDYGAVGNQTNDTKAFQKIFAEEREIYVPRGIYHIDETIRCMKIRQSSWKMVLSFVGKVVPIAVFF